MNFFSDFPIKVSAGKSSTASECQQKKMCSRLTREVVYESGNLGLAAHSHAPWPWPASLPRQQCRRPRWNPRASCLEEEGRMMAPGRGDRALTSPVWFYGLQTAPVGRSLSPATQGPVTRIRVPGHPLRPFPTRLCSSGTGGGLGSPEPHVRPSLSTHGILCAPCPGEHQPGTRRAESPLRGRHLKARKAGSACSTHLSQIHCPAGGASSLACSLGRSREGLGWQTEHAAAHWVALFSNPRQPDGAQAQARPLGCSNHLAWVTVVAAARHRPCPCWGQKSRC